MSKSEIFVKAWKLANAGAARFGGSSKDYFAASLKIVYASLKNQPYYFVLQGSRKYPGWIARVEGKDARYGFARKFMKAEPEDSDDEFYLKDGVYNYGNRGDHNQKFFIVRNGQAQDVEVEDVKLMFA